MVILPIDLTEDTLPVVPFVPFRCPNCRRHKPRTYSQRGRTRLHRCQACGAKYRSLEVDPEDLSDAQRMRELFPPR